MVEKSKTSALSILVVIVNASILKPYFNLKYILIG